MNAEERARALLALVAEYRDSKSRETLDAAGAEARALVAQAFRLARSRVHEAIIDERKRYDAAVAGAEAHLRTRQRLAHQGREAAMLAEGWRLLPGALAERWRSPAGRRRWAETHLGRALASLPRTEWEIAHAPGWAEDERQAAAAWLAAHGGPDLSLRRGRHADRRVPRAGGTQHARRDARGAACRPQRSRGTAAASPRAGRRRKRLSTARIKWISGPVLRARAEGPFKLREAIRVGPQALLGEVIRINEDEIVAQVYEDTTGLRPGVEIEGTGELLGVRLGPGDARRHLRRADAPARGRRDELRRAGHERGPLDGVQLHPASEAGRPARGRPAVRRGRRRQGQAAARARAAAHRRRGREHRGRRRAMPTTPRSCSCAARTARRTTSR